VKIKRIYCGADPGSKHAALKYFSHCKQNCGLFLTFGEQNSRDLLSTAYLIESLATDLAWGEVYRPKVVFSTGSLKNLKLLHLENMRTI